ncbi:MAG: hypothetical protein NTX63_01680 [Candidatus Peregrinibacteria bacterium]|nr:hypothetical protein [Candidatus Peregrinibacteria bacterium]
METTLESQDKKPTSQKMNLEQLMQEMLLVLSPKEKEVMIKRFSLDDGPRLTLEKIGQKFAVTRERIRQIEKIALTKLRRTVQNSKLQMINELASTSIKKCGGVCLESKILAEILNAIGSDNVIDGNIIRLSLNINPSLVKSEKNNQIHAFWRLKEIPMKDVQRMVEVGVQKLQDAGDVVAFEQVAEQIKNKLLEEGLNYEAAAILSSLEVDKRLRKVKDGFGLNTWRHINPRSIRDKAYIVLKRIGNPLHFIEIANKIIESGFDKKVVTVQAVHNELIRYDQFVLVGRGLYALKEWGYKKGTVSEIIEGLLKKKSPLSKQDIILGVLKQRQVKKGTISLNLQKNPEFVRVGRAVYALKK